MPREHEIGKVLERWAKWRQRYRSSGYGKCMTARFMEGMPGTNCPDCGGSGRTPGAYIAGKQKHVICGSCGGEGRVDLRDRDRTTRWRVCEFCDRDPFGRPTGERSGVTCFKCGGRKVRPMVMDKNGESLVKVNPAFIRSTYVTPSDPTSERVDRAVCEMRQREELLGYYFVIWSEYCDWRGGSQEMRAIRIGLTFSNYRKRLERAREWLADAIRDPRPCEVIPFPYKAAS